LKSQIPIRTWADWDDAVPGFVEIDLVGHEGGVASGEFRFTLTVTDIAPGWTANRSVRNKAAKWVFEALEPVVACFPFPILGIVGVVKSFGPTVFRGEFQGGSGAKSGDHTLSGETPYRPLESICDCRDRLPA
jgi:hypothetical protein